MTSPLPTSKLQVFTDSLNRYCSGATQIRNLTSAFSLDYAYLSQFGSNAITYLTLNLGDISAKFKSFTTELNDLDTGAMLDTLVCDDEDLDCDVDEEGLNKMIKNFWESGQLWGEIVGNMFGATIQPDA